MNKTASNEINAIDDIIEIISSIAKDSVKNIEVTSIKPINTELIKVKVLYREGLVFYKEQYEYKVKYDNDKNHIQ